MVFGISDIYSPSSFKNKGKLPTVHVTEETTITSPPQLCKGTISYLKKRKAPKRRYTDLLLFFVDCEICHYSLGKALTNRQAEGTCQLHHLNGQSRVLRCFCSVHKLLQQFTSVKESKLNVPNSLFPPLSKTYFTHASVSLHFCRCSICVQCPC